MDVFARLARSLVRAGGSSSLDFPEPTITPDLEVVSGVQPLDRPRDRVLAERVVASRALVRATDGTGLDVDLTLVMAGFDFEAIWNQRRIFRIDDVDLPVARLAHIVQSKRRAGSDKDRLFFATHADAIGDLMSSDRRTKPKRPARGRQAWDSASILGRPSATLTGPALRASLPVEPDSQYSALRAMFGLIYTPEEEAFRSELRAWLTDHLPRTSAPDDEEERRRFQRGWQRDLAAGGWVGVQWPREYGGRDASLKEQIIFTEEMARARAPEILDAVSVNIVGPTLIRFGTREQKARWLPPIRPAHDVWCLGFSEPNAGSDLASLRCRAVRDGEHWIVSGQKVWSSKAHFADWCLLLVRTDPDAPKHRGISCLVVDMKSPGIAWRPLVQISGRSEFNELFLDEVRVPAANVLGPVNGGWPLIRAALAHERGTLWAFDFKVRLQNGCLALADLYRRCREKGRADVAAFREQVAQAYIEAQVFGAHTLRILPRLHEAGPDAPPEAALQKLFGSEIQQRTLELATAIAGPYAQLDHDPRAIDGGAWAEAYLYSRSVTISSGTSEVLRNLIAQQALGLPRGG